LFDGFLLAKAATKTIPVTLGPFGIDFEGSLPDPTRDLLKPADPNARITGVFRLEGHHDVKGGTTSYWLRLVDGERGAMEQLEARIARAFADLASEPDAPLAIRFDRRPEVPPLFWPMKIDAKGLGLKTTEKVSGEFDMAIHPSAMDARIRTVSGFPGDLPGIAAVHGEYLVWKKKADGFDVTIEAGPTSIEEPTPEVVVNFERLQAPVKWSANLAETFNNLPIEVPLDAVSARLLAAYKSGKVIASDETQPPTRSFHWRMAGYNWAFRRSPRLNSRGGPRGRAR
jgi:hypothetical protein